MELLEKLLVEIFERSDNLKNKVHLEYKEYIKNAVLLYPTVMVTYVSSRVIKSHSERQTQINTP